MNISYQILQKLKSVFVSVMGKGKAPCCDHSQVLKRGPWSDEESEILKAFILQNGHRNWRSIPKLAGQSFCHLFGLTVVLIALFCLCVLKVFSITLHVH